MSVPRTKPSAGLDARAQYDAVAPGAKKRRRNARVETSGETGRDSRQLPPMTRLVMIALVRDAARNFSASRSMLKQLGLNVVGTEFKLRIKVPHEAKNPTDPVAMAQRWFNTVWARNCDFRSDRHLADLNLVTVQSVARDGDCGMLFDRDFTGSGRLAYWESDQICDPDSLPPGVYSTNDGVLLDAYGREIGYFCHNERGKAVAPLAKGHIFSRDPADESKNMFRLLRVPWRHNQCRGTSDLFSVVADLLDVYEMRAKELQSAKVAATFAGVVKKREQAVGPAFSDPRLDPANAAHVGAPGSEPPPPPPEKNYDRLESLTGGALEYLDEDDVFEMLDPKRPNVNAVPFIDAVVKSAGSAFGMARCYSTMEAQTSYTAFRGEMIMTWVMFSYWQKWLERYVQDWQAVRAIQWGVDTKLFPALPDGWQTALAWQHPRMPSVNPLVDQQTFLAALKNGATSLEHELGPGWRDIIDELSGELDVLRDAKIPHAIFETVSGGAAPGAAASTDPKKTTEEDE